MTKTLPSTGALLGALALTLSTLSAGCSSSSGDPKAEVTGKVTYKGQPLTMGTLEFHGPAAKVGAAQISKDGSFTMTDAPTGECTVAVKVVPPAKTPPGVNMGTPDIAPVLVPAQYGDATKSGIKQTIAAGKSTVNIELK